MHLIYSSDTVVQYVLRATPVLSVKHSQVLPSVGKRDKMAIDAYKISILLIEVNRYGGYLMIYDG